MVTINELIPTTKRKEAKVIRLPEEWEVLEAMGIRCARPSTDHEVFDRKEADDNLVYYADTSQINQMANDFNLQQEGESALPHDPLIPEEAWQEVPDFIFFDEPAEQCDRDIESPDLGDDSVDTDVPEHVRARKRGGRRHKGHFMKRPMALAEVIEELQHSELRENALRCLSGHLIERRELDVEFYRQAGFYLFHSCSTVAVLLQEVISVYDRLNAKDLKVRGSKRLANVLTLLQSIAANEETRWEFVKVLPTQTLAEINIMAFKTAGGPTYLMPFILANFSEEVYENIRTLSLSVIAVLCQARDVRITKWAIDGDLMEACIFVLEIGSELSKVIAMAILESLFRKNEGVSALCERNDHLLPKFFKICGDVVNILAEGHGFSPRLLFLTVRALILLCQDRRGLDLLKDHLPQELQDSTFDDLKKDYPFFDYLLHQLLLYTGKARYHIPSAPPPREPKPYFYPSPPGSSSPTWGMEVNFNGRVNLADIDWTSKTF